MFGLIPRSVWSRHVPTDDKGRITVAHNFACFSSALLRRHGMSRALTSNPADAAPPSVAPSLLLIEVGTGDKLDPKMQSIFDLEQNPPGPPERRQAPHHRRRPRRAQHHPPSRSTRCSALISTSRFTPAPSLASRTPAKSQRGPHLQTTTVAAAPPNPAATSSPSQTPPSTSSSANGKTPSPTAPVMTKTYYPDHLFPIADRLILTDSPRLPFPNRLHTTPVPRRAPPAPPSNKRESDPLQNSPAFLPSGPNPAPNRNPNLPLPFFPTAHCPLPAPPPSPPLRPLRLLLVPGHTWGQQAIKFQETDPTTGGGGKGRTIVFTPDVMPTIAHNERGVLSLLRRRAATRGIALPPLAPHRSRRARLGSSTSTTSLATPSSRVRDTRARAGSTSFQNRCSEVAQTWPVRAGQCGCKYTERRLGQLSVAHTTGPTILPAGDATRSAPYHSALPEPTRVTHSTTHPEPTFPEPRGTAILSPSCPPPSTLSLTRKTSTPTPRSWKGSPPPPPAASALLHHPRH